MALRPDTVIAEWISDDSKRGFMLQANGDLVEVTRDSVAHTWSPPEVIAALRRSSALGDFTQFLSELTVPLDQQ